MDTNKLFAQKNDFFKYLEKINLSKSTIWVNQYVINKFQAYCSSKEIKFIENEVIENFYNTNLDYVNKVKHYQDELRRPLLAFIDFYNDKKIKKIYTKRKNVYTINNIVYKNMFDDYINAVILKQSITEGSKNRKRRVIVNFINYLDEINIKNLNELKETHLINYINSNFNNYCQQTKSLYKGIIKEFLLYVHHQKLIKNYSQFLINNKNTERKPVVKVFTKLEIKQILDSINTETKAGKQRYLIFCLLAYYGLRIGDIINLKLNNIDFENNAISIIQRKTKKPLVLPLINEVKFALLDYLKNGRPNNNDEECIILTLHAPYTKYKREIPDRDIHEIIKKSGVDCSNKILGTRVFRHSIATNMINDNVELYKISSILGHTNTKTTSNYITRDINHLRDITLEVCNGK